MSNSRRYRRRVDTDQARTAALAAARRRGCTCTLEVTFDEVTPGTVRARVAHDNHCPALTTEENTMNTTLTCRCGRPAGTGPTVVGPDDGEPLCDACIGDRGGPGTLARIDQSRALVDRYRTDPLPGETQP